MSLFLWFSNTVQKEDVPTKCWENYYCMLIWFYSHACWPLLISIVAQYELLGIKRSLTQKMPFSSRPEMCLEQASWNHSSIVLSCFLWSGIKSKLIAIQKMLKAFTNVPVMGPKMRFSRRLQGQADQEEVSSTKQDCVMHWHLCHNVTPNAKKWPKAYFTQ